MIVSTIEFESALLANRSKPWSLGNILGASGFLMLKFTSETRSGFVKSSK